MIGNDGSADKEMVTDVHEAGAGEVGDVDGERELRIKSNTKIADMCCVMNH